MGCKNKKQAQGYMEGGNVTQDDLPTHFVPAMADKLFNTVG